MRYHLFACVTDRSAQHISALEYMVEVETGTCGLAGIEIFFVC